MNTTISVSMPRRDAEKTRKLAAQRGFTSVSTYLRFLLSEDDTELIPNKELLKLSKEAAVLHARGKLVKAKSLADFLD